MNIFKVMIQKNNVMSRIFSSSLFCPSKMIDSGLTRIICGTSWLDKGRVGATKHFLGQSEKYRNFWKGYRYIPFKKTTNKYIISRLVWEIRNFWKGTPFKNLWSFKRCAFIGIFAQRQRKLCILQKVVTFSRKKWCIFTTKGIPSTGEIGSVMANNEKSVKNSDIYSIQIFLV